MRKFFLSFLLFTTINGLSQKTVIYCGQLIDVNNLQVLKEMTIIQMEIKLPML